MTKREAMRQTHQQNTLMALGFTAGEVEQLRRISITLRRWHELECGVDGGGVERDETTGKTVWYNAHTGRRTPYADRETGARKRLQAIIDRRNARITDPHSKDAELNIHAASRARVFAAACKGDGAVQSYIQTDPRGAALYIIRPGDVPEGKDVDAYYTRGVCVY